MENMTKPILDDNFLGYFEVYTSVGNFPYLESIGIFKGYMPTIALNLAEVYPDRILYFKPVEIDYRYKDKRVEDNSTVSVKINTELLSREDDLLFRDHSTIVESINMIEQDGYIYAEKDTSKKLSSDKTGKFFTVVNKANKEKADVEIKAREILENISQKDIDFLIKNNILNIDNISKDLITKENCYND